MIKISKDRLKKLSRIGDYLGINNFQKLNNRALDEFINKYLEFAIKEDEEDIRMAMKRINETGKPLS